MANKKARNMQKDWDLIIGDNDDIKVKFLMDTFPIPKDISSSVFKFNIFIKLIDISYDMKLINVTRRNLLARNIYQILSDQSCGEWIVENITKKTSPNSKWKMNGYFAISPSNPKSGHRPLLITEEHDKEYDWISVKMTSSYSTSKNNNWKNYAFVFQFIEKEKKFIIHKFGERHLK